MKIVKLSFLIVLTALVMVNCGGGKEVIDMPKDDMVLQIEKLIRSYDPCFSCSTHFLKVNWE